MTNKQEILKSAMSSFQHTVMVVVELTNVHKFIFAYGISRFQLNGSCSIGNTVKPV